MLFSKFSTLIATPLLLSLVAPSFLGCATKSVKITTTILASPEQIQHQLADYRENNAKAETLIAQSVPPTSTPIAFDINQGELDGEKLTRLNAIGAYMLEDESIHLNINERLQVVKIDGTELASKDQRAQSAKAYLEFMGIDSKRIHIIDDEEAILTSSNEQEFFFYKVGKASASLMQL